MNFIERYLEYTKLHEAPEPYHIWSAVTAVAATLGRGVWMDKGIYKIFAGQMMVVLVGGSALVRKSTAVGIARDMLTKANKVNIIQGKSSPEALIDSMNRGPSVNNGIVSPQDAEALLYAPELSAFLSKQSYTEAMIPILTDMADAKDVFVHKTITRGALTLNNVCLSLLGASTPDWLAEAIPPNAFGGGFMSRIIFVYAEGTNRYNPLPSLEDFPAAVFDELVNELRALGTMRGEAKLSPEGRTWFIDWYNKFMQSPGAKQEGYWGRRHDHMLRVAMNIMACKGRMTLLVEDLELADKWLTETEKTQSLCFRYVGASPMAREQERIARLVEQAGGTLSYRELMHMTWRRMDAAVVRQAVENLCSAGVLEMRNFKGGTSTETLLIMRKGGMNGAT